MRKRIAVIANAGARACAGGDVAETLKAAFAKQGAEPTIHLVCDGSKLTETAQAAIDAGCDVLVAAGGDGTVSAVAAVAAQAGVTLGVLPLGTLNHFAKDVGLPQTLDAAAAVVVEGIEREVDLGEVNGRVFINNSSLGLYPSVVRRREGHQRLGRSKWSAFARAAWTVMGRYPLVHVTIEADGRRLRRSTPLVFIGNNDYRIAGLQLGTRAALDSGLLAVYVTRDVGRWRLTMFALRALFGRLRETQEFDVLQTDAVTIDLKDRQVRVATDGEVTRIDAPLEYRIRPRALKVVVPAAAEEPDVPAAA